MYNKILLSSRYSLCPSGSGPNSIRFWESLACGSIPVLLADTLDLPYNPLGEDSIVIVSEKKIKNIDSILEYITEEIDYEMRRNYKLYQYYENVFRNCFGSSKRLFTVIYVMNRIK